MRYWSGVFTGIALSITGALAFLTWRILPELPKRFAHIKGASLTASTKLVMSPAWGWGAPGALLAAVLLLNIALRRSDTALVACVMVVALASLAAILFTVMSCYLPLWEAGAIR